MSGEGGGEKHEQKTAEGEGLGKLGEEESSRSLRKSGEKWDEEMLAMLTV